RPTQLGVVASARPDCAARWAGARPRGRQQERVSGNRAGERRLLPRPPGGRAGRAADPALEAGGRRSDAVSARQPPLLTGQAMHTYAQTNIQLINQLRGESYATSDLRVVVDSYELAALLLTGRFRASGKTFIAHLVGTASILGSLHAPAPLVAAGLLHAVYL